jgi:short-subunit dehydrogenase
MAEELVELEPVDAASFAQRYGPRALVTGGANGIGVEYCRQIAATGLDLVVLDVDAAGLDAIAAEVRDAHGVDVVTAVVDLSSPADELLAEVRRVVGDREISLLVANAAWSPVGPFLDCDLDQLVRALDVNCRAPLVLTHELGTRMVERGRGGIIVMSSLAAEAGSANVVLY